MVLGIDIGGTNIKSGVVDLNAQAEVLEKSITPTPKGASPIAVREVIEDLYRQNRDRINGLGIAFPAVVDAGTIKTATNISKEWIGLNLIELLRDRIPLTCVVGNDADLAGWAEMSLGSGQQLKGKTLFITIGTGLGSALFYKRELIPNLELGGLLTPWGEIVEQYASNRARELHELNWEDWAQRFNVFIELAEKTINPNQIIIGGGISAVYNEFASFLQSKCPITFADFKNNAGVIGAACWWHKSNG